MWGKTGVPAVPAPLATPTVKTSSPPAWLPPWPGRAGRPAAPDGTGPAALFSAPGGLAIDSSGTNLYVAENGRTSRTSTTGNTIRQIVIATGVVTTLAGTVGTPGSADGTGAAATFNSPEGLTVDGAGILIVDDRRNNTIPKVTPAGVVTTVAGQVR